MTKNFCDLCEKPAATRDLRRSAVAKFGRPYQPHGDGQTKRQATVVVTANFSFQNHPTGFGGPPDLCEECAVALVLALAKQYGVTRLAGA